MDSREGCGDETRLAIHVLVSEEHFVSRAPFHVPDQFFFSAPLIVFARRRAFDAPEGVGDGPMACLVGVRLNAARPERWPPVVISEEMLLMGVPRSVINNGTLDKRSGSCERISCRLLMEG